jgi:hypothetical protein
MVLNPTRVGNSFLLLAHISVKLVNNVKKYNHQSCIPKINPGIIMIAFANHEANSTIL